MYHSTCLSVECLSAMSLLRGVNRRDGVVLMRVDPRLYELKKEFDKILCPEVIREAEHLHHKISKLSEDDLLKSFTV